jgi:hypothetical protein
MVQQTAWAVSTAACAQHSACAVLAQRAPPPIMVLAQYVSGTAARCAGVVLAQAQLLACWPVAGASAARAAPAQRGAECSSALAGAVQTRAQCMPCAHRDAVRAPSRLGAGGARAPLKYRAGDAAAVLALCRCSTASARVQHSFSTGAVSARSMPRRRRSTAGAVHSCELRHVGRARTVSRLPARGGWRVSHGC